MGITNWLAKHPDLRRAAATLVAAVPLSVRLGRPFWQWYAFFRESEKWSADQMNAFQLDRVRTLLRRLAESSTFYRNRLGSIDIESIRSLDDFRQVVPTLTREEFARNYDTIFTPDSRDGRLSRAQSSGTTGRALQFYHTTGDDMREWAAISHQWSRVGYDPARSRRAEFRSLTQPGRIVDWYPERNMLRCSVINLKPHDVRQYAEAIRSFRAEFLHGYPSAIHILASTVCNDGIDFPQPRAVLLASEEVHAHQLAAIEQAFPNAKIFAHYGCAERTVLAGWCERRREYHILPQYAIVDVDPHTHEIIGTNLFNVINGFVRYRMTDTVLESDDRPCPDCGRPYAPRIVRLGGRCEDYLYSSQNGWVPPAIITYPLKHLQAVQEVQIRQRVPESLTVRFSTVRPEDVRLMRELDDIGAGLRRLFGADTEITFERTEGFPRTPSGKFRWIINEMDAAPKTGCTADEFQPQMLR
jgi:phenylacetate-CoA ligase